MPAKNAKTASNMDAELTSSGGAEEYNGRAAISRVATGVTELRRVHDGRKRRPNALAGRPS
ncbi:hypothetical protein ARTHRO9AX_10302 [Arthrobacter sp. 9AX]|nr:hypothetical protein ARTHRO9AX_10302 [Arthrobacter sp. 9AX]